MPQKFLNNYRTTVAAQLLPGGLSLTVADATALGVVTPTDFVKLTLVRRSGNEETAWEIIKVTGRTGNVLTMPERGGVSGEGTIPLQWEIGELVSARITRDAMAALTTPLGREFISAPQPLSGGIMTLPHLLGAVPKLVQLDLICNIAEADYSPGDRIVINPGAASSPALSGGVSTRIDATNVVVCPSVTALTLLTKTAGTAFHANYANWSVVVKAYA